MNQNILKEKLFKFVEISKFLLESIVGEAEKKENGFTDQDKIHVRAHYKAVNFALADPFNHEPFDHTNYSEIAEKYLSDFHCRNYDYLKLFKTKTYELRGLIDKAIACFGNYSLTEIQIEYAAGNFEYAADCIVALMHYILDRKVANGYDLKIEDIYYWELKQELNPNQQPITIGRKLRIVVGYDRISYMRIFTEFINDYCKEIEIIEIAETINELKGLVEEHIPDYLLFLSNCDNYIFEIESMAKLHKDMPIAVVGYVHKNKNLRPQGIHRYIDINKPIDEVIDLIFEK